MRKALLAATAGVALLATTGAWAFCGFYVATGDEPLTNKASRVVLVRDGRGTVVTMASDVHGDPRQFALVIPVPTVVRREQVRVVDPATVETLADYTKPRLVEYFDQTPCPELRSMPPLPAPMAMAGIMRPMPHVTVEAAFSVDEYDIQVLSADRGDNLLTWLNARGYRLPPEAAPVVGSYLGQGMHFFVAKVNLDRMKENRSGMLRPIRVSYDTPKFMLPIRLGTVNATGPQDMIVLALTRTGRVEVTNYRTVKMPTGVDIPEYVEDRFGAFYDAVFDRQVATHEGQAVMLEYAWPVPTVFQGDWPAGTLCDPCSGPSLKRGQMEELGVSWTTGGNPGESPATGFVTRLHVRYDRAHFPEDLAFQETPDTEQYQARYVIHHHEVPFAQLRCHAGGRYAATERPAMWAAEQRNLVELTGWDKTQVAREVSAQWARDKPE